VSNTSPSPVTQDIIPFLASFRTVASPEELLDFLVHWLHVPNPQDKSAENVERFRTLMKGPIANQVAEVLRNWLTWFWWDFKDCPELLEQLEAFVAVPQNPKIRILSILPVFQSCDGPIFPPIRSWAAQNVKLFCGFRAVMKGLTDVQREG